MNWSRITPIGDKPCATDDCTRSARWHGVAGGVGSDYCDECRVSIDIANLLRAAQKVVYWDWSDCDDEPRRDIENLRRAVKTYVGN